MTSRCPICGAQQRKWERYPNMLCARCAGLARDAEGRPMRFANETPLGAGFVAEVAVDGSWRRVEGSPSEAECWVDGRPCVAREHRFGGIVVQLIEP